MGDDGRWGAAGGGGSGVRRVRGPHQASNRTATGAAGRPTRSGGRDVDGRHDSAAAERKGARTADDHSTASAPPAMLFRADAAMQRRGDSSGGSGTRGGSSAVVGRAVGGAERLSHNGVRRGQLREGRGALPDGDGCLRVIFPPFFKPSLGCVDVEEEGSMGERMNEIVPGPAVNGHTVRLVNISHSVDGVAIDPRRGNREIFIARVQTVGRPAGTRSREGAWAWRCHTCGFNFLHLSGLEWHFVREHRIPIFYCRMHLRADEGMDEDEAREPVDDDFSFLADLYSHYGMHDMFDVVEDADHYYSPQNSPSAPAA